MDMFLKTQRLLLLLGVILLQENCTADTDAVQIDNLSKFQDDYLTADIGELLLELVDRMKPGHCYAFITDDVYETVLGASLFTQIKRQPRYVLNVAQEEDTLHPRERLSCMLKEIRNVGCGAYIILLANAIQAERLLRFGDRTRIIDTRAKFIILHDYRLFVPRLHYLWKRLVNVVFVRQLRAKFKNIRPRYELSTVPFPIPVRGIFFTKLLNFWHIGKFRFPRKFFMDKTINLGGHTMRAVVLRHTPAVFKNSVNESNSQTPYYGMEIELLKAIAQAMHFEIQFYETDDAATEQWGRMSENETFTGLLGEMNENRADFALADLHYTPYHLQIMDLSIPYNTLCLTFLTPEALSDNSWKTLILPFRGDMWAGVVISSCLVGLVFFSFSKALTYIHRHEQGYHPELDLIVKHCNKPKAQRKAKSVRFKKERRLRLRFKTMFRLRRKTTPITTNDAESYAEDKKLKNLKMIPFKRRPQPWRDPRPPEDIFDSFIGCFMYTYSMLMLVSLPRLPKGWPLRVLTGWYWIYCVLVVVAYRASFTAILANPVPKLTIDTLLELAESPIQCGAWGEENRLFFQNDPDPISQAIGDKLEHAPDADTAVDKVVDGMYAFYENIYLLKQLRSTRSSQKARETLHIMSDCAVHMPIALGLEKNSPLRPHVDRHVRSLVEGGLTRKWLSDAIEQFQSNVEVQPPGATINLKKMLAGFIALLIGYTAALAAFIGEKLYWKLVVEKHPDYDKYLMGMGYKIVRIRNIA